jgi:hypothetical protein
MSQELKRELYIKELGVIMETDIAESICDRLFLIDDMTAEDEANLVAEKKAKEIADWEAKKLEAEAILSEATTKLSTLKADIIEVK